MRSMPLRNMDVLKDGGKPSNELVGVASTALVGMIPRKGEFYENEKSIAFNVITINEWWMF